MAIGNFLACYALSRISEGGYVDHPDDNGGPTNYGVTQGTYDAYRKREGKPLRDVRLIEQSEVKSIYEVGYWDTVNADSLPKGLDYAVFDAALTAGPKRAVKFLQGIVGAKTDGDNGPNTRVRVGIYVSSNGIDALIAAYSVARLAHMKGLSDWPVFGKGWSARVNKVRDEAVKMSQ